MSITMVPQSTPRPTMGRYGRISRNAETGSTPGCLEPVPCSDEGRSRFSVAGITRGSLMVVSGACSWVAGTGVLGRLLCDGGDRDVPTNVSCWWLKGCVTWESGEESMGNPHSKVFVFRAVVSL